MKQILPICLFLLLMTGCKERPEVSASLDRTEELMESAPDSALTLLQTLDTETFRRRSTHARNALLFTQSQDKNYIDETNDSLISIAVDHYRQHGDVRPRFLSLYYKGRVQTNAGDHLNAMLAYVEAEELVEELRDNYYTGLLYTQMGNIYGEYYDFPKSLEAYQKAEKHYYTADKGLHYLYALVNQSTIYRNLNDYAMSDSLLHFVLKEAEIIENLSLQKLVLGNSVMQYEEQGKMDKALSMYMKLIEKFGIEDKTSAFLSSVVSICLSDGQHDEAERMLQLSWDKAETADDSVACHLAASEMYRSRHQYEKALEAHEAGIMIQNRLLKENLQQPILTYQRDYLAQKLDYEAYKRKINRYAYLLLIIVLCISLLTMALYVYKKVRMHYHSALRRRLKEKDVVNLKIINQLKDEAELREKSIRSHLEQLKEDMKQKNVESLHNISKLQEEIRINEKMSIEYRLQSEKLIDTLSDENIQLKQVGFQLVHSYFTKMSKWICIANRKKKENVTDTNGKLMYEVIKEEIRKYTDGERGYKLLEETVNKHADGIMIHLRNEMDFSEEEQYRQMCYHFAGFSINAIAFIMNYSTNKIYKRKERLMVKIRKENTVHAQLYINLLSKQL